MGAVAHRALQVLKSANETEEARYLAFPSILKWSEERVLVIYKNGTEHYKEKEAKMELLAFNPQTNEVSRMEELDAAPGIVNQNGELLPLPNGDLVIYIDRQKSGSKDRMGVIGYRSQDGGQSFAWEGDFPVAGGYQFGYVFDGCASPDGKHYDLLIMSFPELRGGERAVHAVRTRDEGRTWSYVRHLNEEFDYQFNESSLLVHEGDYLIAARGDDGTARLYRTDGDFSLKQQSILPIPYIGRPKLFEHEGQIYLLCRTIEKGTGELHLFRCDPNALSLVEDVTLDVDPNPPSDSYYAESYFMKAKEKTLFHVITYRPLNSGDKPSIIRLEYDWNELFRERKA